MRSNKTFSFLIGLTLLVMGFDSKAQNQVDGKALFQDNCTACHSLDKDIVGPALQGIHERRTGPWIKSFIKNSQKVVKSGDEYAVKLFEKYKKTEMTAFESSLSDAQIDALVTYLKDARPEPVAAPAASEGSANAPAVPAQPAMPQEMIILLCVLAGLGLPLVGALFVTVLDIKLYLDSLLPKGEVKLRALGSGNPFLELKALFDSGVTNKVMAGHDYDGIVEMDNGMPRWLSYFFYGTVAFAVVYVLHYEVFKFGDRQSVEYDKEVAEATVRYGSAGERVKIALVQLTAKDQVDKGAAIYAKNCAACHGKAAEGGVGPNLTDVYWLHGGKIEEVFQTVREGVPAKGMISWKGKLSDEEILQTASYIASLKGSNPANAKEAQGEKVE